MKRRNFITALAAILAAPFSLFARPKSSGISMGLASGKHFIGTPIDDDGPFFQAVRDGERDRAAKKAAGPWRIVEQSEDGTVVLERDGCSPLSDDCRVEWPVGHVTVDDSGKSISIVLSPNVYTPDRKHLRRDGSRATPDAG